MTGQVYEVIGDDGETRRAAGKTNRERRIEDLLGSVRDLGDSAFICVYRQRGNGQQAMSLIGEWPADEFTSMGAVGMHLKEKYGGGRFRVHVRVDGKLVANEFLEVESPIREKSETTGEGLGGVMEAVFRRMDRQDEVLAALVARLESPAPVMSTAEMRREVLTEIKELKDIFGGGQAQGLGGMAQITETVALLKTLGMEVGPVGGSGGGDDEGGMMRLLERAMPVLQSAIERGPQVPPKQGQLPAPMPAHQPDRQNQSELDMINSTAMAVTYAVSYAKNGGEPGNFAELAVGHLGEAKARELVAMPNPIAELESINAGVSEHRAWFGLVLEHVKAILGLPSTVADQYEVPDDVAVARDKRGSSGNPTNPKNDGKAGKAGGGKSAGAKSGAVAGKRGA